MLYSCTVDSVSSGIFMRASLYTLVSQDLRASFIMV